MPANSHTHYHVFRSLCCLLILSLPLFVFAQKPLKVRYTPSGILSAGVRMPFALTASPEGLNFSQGIGSQIRLQLGTHYNTEWYTEYIRGKEGDSVIRNDLHFGASFILYPQFKLRRVQPFVMAGPALDYSKVHEMTNKENQASRWNLGVAAGLGMHINVTWRTDITLSTQYMFHFGNKIESLNTGEQLVFVSDGKGVDGHLLFTLSMNFKMMDLWKKIRW